MLLDKKIKVEFISEEAHQRFPQYYPCVGTIGEITGISGYAKDMTIVQVQWPEGTTSDEDEWLTSVENIKALEVSNEEIKDNDIQDEEIYKMLIPKLKKNFPCTDWEDYTNGYEDDIDIAKAVALVYRAGYGRGSKGKPFLYQNIKENNEKDVPLC